MVRIFLLTAFALLIGAYSVKAQDQSNLCYPEDPDTQVQPGVPQGEVLHFKFDQSKIYPGTQREYWVYVPKQYDPAQPACLFFDLDGIQFNAPVVLDNLIHKKEIPVTIGVFVSSGTILDEKGNALKFDRSYEFDAVNDDFVRFITEELLPDAEKQQTSDGRPIRISKDGKDRAIAGCSSGGIGAFTAAWERPDLFSRVYSCIGTFVGMRGGDRYPVLIRKTEPKPIRIFLQDGVNDTWNPLFGNWFKANIDMEAALGFAGYEVGHAWGEGGHDGIQGTAIFPDVMRWLWRNWPEPVGKGVSGNDMLKSILLPDEEWVPAATGTASVGRICGTPSGELFMCNTANNTISIMDKSGTVGKFADSKPCTFMAPGENGQLLCTYDGQPGITAYDKQGGKKQLQKKSPVQSMLQTSEGNLYLIEQENSKPGTGAIKLIRKDGSTETVATDLYTPSCLALSPDHTLLFAADRSSHWIYCYVIAENGNLKYGQRFYWLHTPESNDGTPDRSGASALATDKEGNLYAATNMGVQVCDRNGRVRAILTLPGGAVTDLCFGGADMDTLYIVCNGKLYKRKMRLPGAPLLTPPIVLNPGGPG